MGTSKRDRQGGVERSVTAMARDRALEEVTRQMSLERIQHQALDIQSVQPLHGAVTEFVAANAIATARAVSSLARDEAEQQLLLGIYEPFYARSQQRVRNFGL
ncbi:hypothetical protein [Dietzia cinnamea]|uniref:hypothetical protein n=1 Tax=Dietzia cinnamea TaxID=321318 RepID=UPI00223AA4B4|nr:hypothetical protein [Dietzia cinnamea]MCT2077891.1 hypothetical protein [Dietzia cinnamea]MCT2221315.1 hypothetical protein [Dietzia cinnamea]